MVHDFLFFATGQQSSSQKKKQALPATYCSSVHAALLWPAPGHKEELKEKAHPGTSASWPAQHADNRTNAASAVVSNHSKIFMEARGVDIFTVFPTIQPTAFDFMLQQLTEGCSGSSVISVLIW